MLADETGLPVGIKSAVGDLGFWEQLTELMATTGRGVDFVTIDGGEGGTGASPLVFTDSVALPFRLGFSRVYRQFAERGLHERVVFVGAGNFFEGTGDGRTVRTKDGLSIEAAASGDVTLLVRPEKMTINGGVGLPCRVEEVLRVGVAAVDRLGLLA